MILSCKISYCKAVLFTVAFLWGEMMSKNLEVSPLLDYYGGMLTEKQRDLAELYYNEDLSLAEIAELTGITRQGVHDSIKRTESMLLEYEKNIGIARKTAETIELLTSIRQLAEAISTLSDFRYSSDVYTRSEKIRQLAGEYLRQYE